MDKPTGILPPGLEQFRLVENDTAAQRKELGQDEFFDLMITQLQNQDPFKPMESGDFLGQIAQFSTVSGISELRQSFATLASSLQSSQALHASTMVGREVVVPRDTVTLKTDGNVPLSATLPSKATSVKLTVADDAGQVVRQTLLGPRDLGALRYDWDGLNDAAIRAPAGAYTIQFEATIDGRVEVLDTAVRARVDSVTLSRTGLPPTLNVDGLGSIDISEVLEIL